MLLVLVFKIPGSNKKSFWNLSIILIFFRLGGMAEFIVFYQKPIYVNADPPY